MSCISLTLGKPYTGDVSIINPSVGSISTSGKPTGWFDIDAVNTNPSVTTLKIGNVNISILLVCRTGTGNYLLVRPTETMWITVDKSIDYDIRSNTDWNIN